MLYKKILKNIILLIQGKIKAQDIPPKIIFYVLDHSRLARGIKRSRFLVNDVIFRTINLDDKPRYIEFVRNYFKGNSPGIETNMSIPICNAESLYYVVLYKDKIVGGVGLRKIPYRDNNLWQISGLIILHYLRGYGIGERLLRTIVSAIEKKNFIIFLDVFKDNRRAIKLYKKVGFSITDERDKFEIGNIKYPPERLVMVLEKRR